MNERIVLTAMLSLAIAACGEEPSPAAPSAADANAQGEILGGSISDAMLPLGSVQSQSPPRAGEGDAGTTGDAAASGDEAADPAPAETGE